MVPHPPPKLSFFLKLSLPRDFLEFRFFIRVSLVTQAGLGTAFQAVLPQSSTVSLQCDFSWTCCYCFIKGETMSWDHHLNMQPLLTRWLQFCPNSTWLPGGAEENRQKRNRSRLCSHSENIHASTVAAFRVIHTPAPIPHTRSANKFNKLVSFSGWTLVDSAPFVLATLGGGADVFSISSRKRILATLSSSAETESFFLVA